MPWTIFAKKLHFRSLARPWIHLCIPKLIYYIKIKTRKSQNVSDYLGDAGGGGEGPFSTSWGCEVLLCDFGSRNKANKQISKQN